MEYKTPACAEDYLRRFEMDESTVDPIKICHALGIKVITYRKAKELIEALGFSKFTEGNDGFCVMLRKRPVIFYDDETTTPERQRSTIAHELGHFANGDFEHDSTPCMGHCCDKCREWKADSFAFRLLFPDPTVGTRYAAKPKTKERSDPQ